MGNLRKFVLLPLLLALGMAGCTRQSGVHKEAKEPEAVTETVELTPEEAAIEKPGRPVVRDSMNFVRVENCTASEYGSDPSNFTSLSHARAYNGSGTSAITWATCTTNSTYFNLVENSANQYFHFFSVMLKFSVSVPAASTVNATFNFGISGTITASKSPDFALELCERESGPTGMEYHQETYDTATTNSMGRFARRGAGSVSGNLSKTLTFDNFTGSAATKNAYFIFSGYAEQSSANRQITAARLSYNSVALSTTQYICSSSTTSGIDYHTSISGAVARCNQDAYNNTSVITLYRDATVTGGMFITSNLTFDLNGHNMTQNESDPQSIMFGIRDNLSGNSLRSVTLRFMNSGGSRNYVRSNAKDAAIYLNPQDPTYGTSGCKALLYVSNNVTIENTGNGSGVRDGVGVTIEIQTGGIVKADNQWALRLYSGSTKIYGSVQGPSSSGYAIRLIETTADVYLLGNTVSITGRIYVTTGTTVDADCQIHCNYGNEYYTSTGTINVEFASSPANGTILAYGFGSAGETYAGSFKLVNDSSTKDVWYISNGVRVVGKAFTVTYNAMGGTGTMANSSVRYGGTFTIPSCGFTAPQYRTFKHWNTQSNDQGTTYNVNDTWTVTGNLNLFAIWYKSHINEVEEFAYEYLKMETYTTNSGYCADSEHHYYSTAKDWFMNTMSPEARTYFNNNGLTWVKNARSRFFAWAHANGETLTWNNGSSTYNVQTLKAPFQKDTKNMTMSLIVLGLGLTLAAGFGAYLFLKRKRQK